MAPTYLRFIRKLSTWMWCFAHLPRIHTTVEATASGAASQQRLIEDLERITRELIENLERVTGLEKKVNSLKREVMFQQRRLTRLAEVPAPPMQARPDTTDHRLDALYVAFEDVFRGTREDIKARLRPYIDRLALCAGQPGKPILDIGCGRGEWLETLKEAHLQAYGIDSNLMMVEYARSLGLDAQEVDLMTHLRDLPDASRSAVTAFHVVEHLGFGVLVDFLDEALRVIMPGGMLILETPNPENLLVGAHSFYNDPTHRNPIPPEPLRFLVDQRGFTEVEILRLHPFPAELRLGADNDDTRRLNNLLFGPQDYAVIARRP